jgi:5-methylcytosine-specific restriction protein B
MMSKETQNKNSLVKLTGVEAGLNGGEQIRIALQTVLDCGGKAQMADITDAVRKAVEARKPGSTLSDQGDASLRMSVNTVAVKAGYLLPYDESSPGWQITPAGKEFLGSKPDQPETASQAYWFVGAIYGGNKDQLPRFLSKGIWENGYTDKYLDLVKAIKPGDRIAIKSAYTRKLKKDLPFDNRGHTVSVMAIKAVGTVTKNTGDGRTVQVDWTKGDSNREWYFKTYWTTICRAIPGDWMTDELIAFTFDNKPQDIDRFRNAPNWKERFGGKGEQRFHWTQFYEEVADKLLAFRNNRAALIAGIYDIAGRVNGFSKLQDQYADGTTGPLKDICPFTTIGIFNRGITDDNRKAIAAELAKFLGVKNPVPDSFEGIPVLFNLASWYFDFEKARQSDDIDVLWEVFASAIKFVESDETDSRSAFINAYNKAIGRHGVGLNLSMGLYWIRPWRYLSLDNKSQLYISDVLNADIPRNGPRRLCTADDYLAVVDKLEGQFKEDAYPVHSFPELSLAAWQYKGHSPNPVTPLTEGEVISYSIEDIVLDGCFIERSELVRMLERLQTKKNMILQGPPGTGKTWVARRLAFALIGQRDKSKVRVVQFHPNLSYEDFVRGLRPSAEGKLSLLDGPFLEMITVAKNNQSDTYVMVIEEINRGNPAQIFGELLTLMEADKRNENEAIELCYRQGNCEPVFIPDNLYVIGTMNIADRSLALVDLALRRRFAFVDLVPTFGQVWKDWVNKHYGIDFDLLNEIEQRIIRLNDEIANDKRLGSQFQIGHSYVTPSRRITETKAREWFKQVVETEIGPLLDEYWFDDRAKARENREALIKDFK